MKQGTALPSPRPIVGLLATALLVLGSRAVLAEDLGWPREIAAPEGEIVLYQPQVESFEGDHLTARAAVSVKVEGQDEPAFGAVWMATRVEIDRDERIVDIVDVKVPRVRFPESTLEQEARLSEILETEIPKWELSIALDRLVTSLEVADQERAAAEQLGTRPPRIIVTNSAAMLVTIDGDPKLNKIDGSTLMRVINTPFLIVLDSSTSTAYYLYAGQDAWYRANDLEGDWTFVDKVPEEVAKLAPDESDIELPEADDEDSETIPRIIVATEPTELIYTTGEPDYTPVTGNELMYISNSDSDVFLEIETQHYFVLLSGRWYRSASLEGPWTFLPADELPTAFREIPADSEVGDVRSFVAGTEEATDAALDAQIPQTAMVERGVVELEVVYDGAPKFEKIDDTELQYAVNTASVVIRDGNRYFACDDGVWYVSKSPMGPWEVSDERPEDVESIPPESPVYNVKYVYIYNSTPEVVYVGYTPGYTCTYVYGGTIVYGTGFWYPGWHGTVYYARPATWGFHVRWNPWTGWSFGLTYNNGWFTFGIGVGRWNRWHGGWWGPGRFHGYWRGYNRGFYHGWNRGFYHGARAGYRAGYRSGQRSGYARSNLYRESNRPGVTTRDTRPDRQPGAQPGRPDAGARPTPDVARDRKNDVYADRNGNVYQRDREGNWNDVASSRDRQSAQPQSRDRSPGMDSNTKSQLNSDYNSRQRGTQRSNQYQRSRSAGGRSSGGGGGRRR